MHRISDDLWSLHHVLSFIHAICCQALIRDGFAAVGILEEWNKTMALFNKAVVIPGMDWEHEFADEGKDNVNSKKDHEQSKAQVLKDAWTDDELKKYIWLDLLLYEHAVDVFRQQVLSHGLA